MSQESKLKISADRKTRFYNQQANAFGLLPGPAGTCPYATKGKDGCWYVEKGKKMHTCYVDKLITRLPNTLKVLKHNTEILKDSSNKKQYKLLCKMFNEFYQQEKKQITPQMYFRLHWSGDIFSSSYAKALRDSILEFPDINFWTYTRSLPYVHYFDKVKNLSLYISLDRQNYREGMNLFCRSCNPNLKIAYMAPKNDLSKLFECPTGKFKVPKLKICPVDSNKMHFEGSCAECRMCVDNSDNKHIFFKTR